MHLVLYDGVQNVVLVCAAQAVAVDLSTWLMQAQTQPALMANFDSPYACAVKVVFDRVRPPAHTADAATPGAQPTPQQSGNPRCWCAPETQQALKSNGTSQTTNMPNWPSMACQQ